jgi:hypothetical protein
VQLSSKLGCAIIVSLLKFKVLQHEYQNIHLEGAFDGIF